ncbi:chemotaxis protein CheC [Geminocystis sp. GBBB08]|uniref:chemotaxis protein CheC n=1 Tax=Geminocystis sp. GBBB08 TaxID=2604140 RepID=UPI0027E29763|nr:chemotaxis protein CheC [Geminocystis sp. GBBB08]MBL1210955.1 chemotaxis protein CheC [Geminocystis sp. GBBB08]
MNLTDKQIDALQEIIIIGVGQAAGVLNEMLSSHITLQIPFIKTFSPDLVKQELGLKLGKGKLSAVELEFFGSINGNAELVFPSDSAAELVSILTDEDMEFSESDLDELKVGALTEIGNIVISGVMGAISNLLSQNLEYFLPSYIEGNIESLIKNKNLEKESTLVLAQTRFFIEETNIQGDIILIFHLGSFHKILEVLERLEED